MNMKTKCTLLLFATVIIQRVLSKINAPLEEFFVNNSVKTTRSLKDVYQMKLYWTRGMEWQGYSKEFAWCAECHTDCEYGDVVVIKECDEDKKDQRWIFEDDKIKPYKSPELCITARDDLEGYVNLRTCYEKRDKYQKFNLFDDDDEEFQIKPKAENDLCLTQNHHPREGENLKFYSCRKAEEGDTGKSDDTSRWIVGKFDGDHSFFD